MQRPYGIWDANAKAWLRWRWYKTAKNAQNGAWRELQWCHVGSKLEVLHRGSFRLVRQYWVTAIGECKFGELYESEAAVAKVKPRKDRPQGQKIQGNNGKKESSATRTIH